MQQPSPYAVTPPLTAPYTAPYTAQIHTWHIVISGFSETLARPCGSELLWWQIGRHDAPGVRTDHWLWNSDWAAVAEKIFRFRPLGPSLSTAGAPAPRIHVYAYSWGGGWGFPRLAHELRKRGLAIETAVLTDPVYRHPLWSLAWLSLVRGEVVVAPDNVKNVWWFYQRENLPAGHRVIAADPGKTHVRHGMRACATHSYMDELPAYHALSLKIALGQLKCLSKCGAA